MLSSRVSQALSNCRSARNNVMSRIMHRDSAGNLANVPKAEMQNQIVTRNYATKIKSKANKEPDVLSPGLRIANIGRNQEGSADVVMQTYGSWHKRSMTGGAAWIMKDDHLQVIHGGCLQSHSVSALQMEVLACLHGIEWARTHRFHNVSIYTNSRHLVQLLQGSVPLDISLIPKIQEIRYQALLLKWCCVHKVPKTRVRLAYNAAIACRAGILAPDIF